MTSNTDLPIPLPPNADPMQMIEQIATGLAGHHDKDVRRQARRLLGAVEAYWAEAGADDDELTPHQANAILEAMRTDQGDD